MGARWTQSDDRFLQENAGTLSSARIGEAIGHSSDSVQRRAHRLGVQLGFQQHRHWTAAEISFLKDNYRKVTGDRIAEHLGMNRKTVFNKAFALGLCTKQRFDHAKVKALIAALHPQGYSDTEIGARAGLERHSVSKLRKGMDLPCNAGSQRQRDKVREKTRQQLAAAGVRSLAELRVKAFADRAAAAGWPADLRPRAVQMLNALWERGPMTRRELAEAIGMPWNGSRKSLVSNDPEGTYLQHLINRGLVMNLGRINKVTGKSGHSTCVYSLPPWIERRACNERPGQADGIDDTQLGPEDAGGSPAGDLRGGPDGHCEEASGEGQAGRSAGAQVCV